MFRLVNERKRNKMSALHLTIDNFDEVVSKGRVLVDFWAGWCMPCRMVAPIIEELSAEYEGRVTVAKVDVDVEGVLASRYGIFSIPTVILFNNGAEEKRFSGVQPKEIYKAELEIRS